MPGAFQDDFPANPEQAEHWNLVMAEKWVAEQAAIDARLRPITELLIACAGAAPGERAIDVGCGTGALLLVLAERVAPGGTVLGIDFSAPMLAAAARRLRAAGRGNATVGLADAQTHGFDAAAFDLVASRFGVMFFNDPVAAFRNLHHALRPGGRIAFVCWAELAANPWFAIPLEAGVRRLGEPEPSPPRVPGPFAFSEATYVEEILARAGFADIAVARTESVIAGAPSALEEARFACHMGPAARLIRERAPDDAMIAAAIVDEVSERFRQFETEAGVRLPATVLLASARRSGSS